MNKLSIEDLDVKGKKVLLRVDFNVPLDENQKVTDDTRILAALPTIKYLLAQGARLVLVSHLGRPKGKQVDSLSLRPVAERLEKILEQRVHFSPSILGPVAQSAIDLLKDGEVLLLENIRFYPEEEKNDSQFSKELASLVDKYVNDAFGTAHRAHGSTEGAARYFDDAACGYLMKKELDYLATIRDNPPQPFTAIVGGAKVKDKIQLIMRLLEKADNVLIGGGMAYSFLHVQGHKIGKSILDEEHLNLCHDIFAKAKALGKGLYLPSDHIVATEFNNECPAVETGIDIPDGSMGMDIGPKTIATYSQVIAQAKTIFWNGPMGVFEMSNFQKGTFAIAQAVANNPGTTVVGGGDSVEAVNRAKLADKMSHISTGGGASLEFIQGNLLPGVEALAERK